MKKEKIKRASLWLVTATLTVSLSIIGLTSCDKDNNPLKSTTYSFSSDEFADLYNLLPNIDYGRLSIVSDGILRFQSFDHFEAIYDQLERNCEMWDSLFLVSHANLSDTSLEDYETLNGYDEFLPLAVFEHDFNISSTSLRKAKSLAFENWLNNNLVGEIPNDALIDDDVEQALFNIYHEICIGDTIYSIRKEGNVLIPLDSIGNIRRYRLLPFDELSEIFPVVPKGWNGDIDYSYIPNNWKDTIHISSNECFAFMANAPTPIIHNGKHKPKLVTKVINLKYKPSNNKYVTTRRKTSLEAKVVFYWQEENLITGTQSNDTLGELSKFKEEKKRKTRKVVIKGSIEDRDNTHFTFGVKRNPSATTIINGVEYPISIVF